MEENVLYGKLSDVCNCNKNTIIADRVNSFAQTCGMKEFKLSKVRGTDIRTISGNLYPESKSPDFFINSREIVDELGNDFLNYYNRDELYLPFILILNKAAGNDEYVFLIQSVSDEDIMFSITKNYFRRSNIAIDICTFYYKTKDFKDVLRIIRTFVYNPEFAFVTYKTIYDNKMPKKIEFNREDLDGTIMHDVNLGPLSETEAKKIKK